MTYQEKATAYRQLVAAVRTAYLEDPNGLKWCEDCQEINLWTYWQGRGSLDARIMLVGQDWGAPQGAPETMANIRAMNRGVAVPYMWGNDNPTDAALVRLFKSIGYDITCHSEKNKDLFFTNLVLGYRDGRISGNFQKSWAEHDKAFFADLVRIIEPEVILCLGRDTFMGVLSAFPQITPPVFKSYNCLIEGRHNPVPLPLRPGKEVRIFALAHCGRLGTLNRNRGEAEKTSLKKQLEDWKKITL